MHLNHPRVSLVTILVALLAGSAGLTPLRGTPKPKKEITVSAAISLKDVLDEITQLFRAEVPDTVIHFNLGASGSLEHQIEEGAPVDAFISASEDQMNSLESKGLLLPGTRRDLLGNVVVLVVRKGQTGISSFQDLARPEVKHISIGEPKSVPAGKYAQEVLTHFHLYEQLKPKFVLAADVRQVLTYVSTGNVDAGIVYATDAQSSPDVSVVTIAPEDSHTPVIYPVAILKSSKDPGETKRFLDFLSAEKAQGVFKKYGFKPAGK
jgi:molybdate transport system substrate-binding protein